MKRISKAAARLTAVTMHLTCEWCGQPASRTNPALCAECYYKYWQKTRFFGSADELPEYSVIANGQQG